MKTSSFMVLINILGSAFICHVGYKLATSDGIVNMKKENLPDFKHGFLLQWLNPKAWAACFAGVALFASPVSNGSLYLFISIYFFVCFFGIGAWAYLGEKVLIFVNRPARMRYFNRTMGSILILITVFMLFQQIVAFSVAP